MGTFGPGTEAAGRLLGRRTLARDSEGVGCSVLLSTRDLLVGLVLVVYFGQSKQARVCPFLLRSHSRRLVGSDTSSGTVSPPLSSLP